MLAVNIFRVAQKEKRYHGKEGVSHRVYAALFVEKKKKSAVRSITGKPNLKAARNDISVVCTT